jgi:hypothetical protein
MRPLPGATLHASRIADVILPQPARRGRIHAIAAPESPARFTCR